VNKRIALASVFALTLAVPGHRVAADEKSDGACLAFEPQVVTLQGKLSAHQFYGPPGYGEEPATDSRERGYVLDLVSPICVKGNPGSDLNAETVRKVRHVQVGPGRGKTWKDLESQVGKLVLMRGTLSSAITGHHHTPVLMDVTEIR
jgi:hypothetical protein